MQPIAKQWKNQKNKKINKFFEPVFIILEEAHVFIPKDHDTAAKILGCKKLPEKAGNLE